MLKSALRESSVLRELRAREDEGPMDELFGVPGRMLARLRRVRRTSGWLSTLRR